MDAAFGSNLPQNYFPELYPPIREDVQDNVWHIYWEIIGANMKIFPRLCHVYLKLMLITTNTSSRIKIHREKKENFVGGLAM